MECAVTVSKIVTFGFTRFLLIIHLDVAVAVIHKDADLAWGQFTAFLNPCDLTIVINRLHTIAARPRKAPSAVTVPTVPAAENKNITDKPKRFVRFYLPISAYGAKPINLRGSARSIPLVG